MVFKLKGAIIRFVFLKRTLVVVREREMGEALGRLQKKSRQDTCAGNKRSRDKNKGWIPKHCSFVDTGEQS